MFWVPLIAGAAKGMAVGAGIGAAGAAITGGDVGRGALMGGATGGVLGGIAPAGQMARFAGTPIGEAGAMATQFNRGLGSAVGLGAAPAGKAGSAGASVGQGLTSMAGQGLVSRATTPNPPQTSTVRDYGMPAPIAMNQQRAPSPTWETISIAEAFNSGLQS